jgi:AcrR family transcriptional regulator
MGHMASRRDWLEAGLRLLGEEGARALTIDRLSERLSLTKGSFYHHFKGMAGFKTDLLQHFETTSTIRYIDRLETAGGSAGAKLDRLLDLVLADEGIWRGTEVGFRAWALQDAEVRAAQERVDRLRIDYLQALSREVDDDETHSVLMARLLYLVLIGAEQVIPPVPPGELRDIYQLITRLVPRNAGKSG